MIKDVQLLSWLLLVPPAIVVGLIAWFAADMRAKLVSQQRSTQLAIDGKWRELEEHYKLLQRPRRPFIWLHQKLLLPGGSSILLSIFFYKQGRLEEALEIADRAVREIDSKPRIFRSIYYKRTADMMKRALRIRALALSSLGQYDEARKVVSHLQDVNGLNDHASSVLAHLEFNCGHLDEALTLARATPPEDIHFDSMRGILASALSLKGEHEKAVEALLFESANLSKFYSPGDMASVGATDEGSKLIELQSKKIEGIFQPIRLLLLASVYNAGEEFQKAEQVLDQVDKALGPEPVIRASYYRNRAFCSAGKGQVALALGYIEQTRSLTSQSSRRSAIWDSHFVIGRAYIYLGRFKEAFAELCVAEQSALHPIEKHRTSYWLGRACQADGVPDKAKAYYEAVAASAIPSWMRKSAADALARGI